MEANNKSERQKEAVVVEEKEKEKGEGSSSSYVVDDDDDDYLIIESFVKKVFKEKGVAICDDFNMKDVCQNKYGPHQIEHLKKIIIKHNNNCFDFDPKIAVAANMLLLMMKMKKGTTYNYNEEVVALPKDRCQELRYKVVYDMVAIDVRETKKEEFLYKLTAEHLALKNSYEQLQKDSHDKIKDLEKNLEDLRAQLKVVEGNVMKKAARTRR